MSPGSHKLIERIERNIDTLDERLRLGGLSPWAEKWMKDNKVRLEWIYGRLLEEKANG